MFSFLSLFSFDDESQKDELDGGDQKVHLPEKIHTWGLHI